MEENLQTPNSKLQIRKTKFEKNVIELHQKIKNLQQT